MDGSDQESVRAAVLQLIMDHLEWEGMLLEREAVAEAYRLRFGDPDADTTAWLRTDADGSAGDGSRLLKLVQAAVHAEPRGRGASAGRPAAVAAAVAAAVPSMSAAITPASAALHSSAADELFFDEVDTPAGRVTQVRGGTLPRLVRHLCDTVAGLAPEEELVTATARRLSRGVASGDVAFVDAFFLTLPDFADAEEVADLILATYDGASASAQPGATRRAALRTLLYWVRNHFSVLPDDVCRAVLPRLQRLARAARTHGVPESEALLDGAAEATRALQAPAASEAQLQGLAALDPSLDLAAALPADLSAAALPASALWSLPEDEVARQWTLVDSQMFAAIPLHEFLDKAWSRPRYEHRAESVLRLVDRFNAVSLWVTSAIVQCATPEERAARIRWLVRLAQRLHALNNFHGAVAVTSGITKNAVARMHRTQALVTAADKAALEDLGAAFSEDGRYKAYREALRRLGDGTPAVPHLAIHLSDLTFMEDGAPDHLPENEAALNFSKWQLIASVIELLRSLQGRRYAIQPVPHIANLVNAQLRPHFYYFDEDRDRATNQLFSISMQLEPNP